METMNIALPNSLKAFVEAQVTSGGYSSASEYIREGIRVRHVARNIEAILEQEEE